MENFIFTESGVSNSLGEFKAGQIRSFDPEAVDIHVKRDKILRTVSGLSKDDCREYLARLNIFDIVDNLKVGEMQNLLELCTEAIERGTAIPKKPTPEKLLKILKGEDDSPEEIKEEVTESE